MRHQARSCLCLRLITEMYPARCNEGSISLTLTASERVCKYQHHSILYWITVQPVRVLHYPLACVRFLNKKIKTKQKKIHGVFQVMSWLIPGSLERQSQRDSRRLLIELVQSQSSPALSPRSVCLSVCWSPAGLSLMKCRLTAGGASYKLTEKPHGV